MTDAPSHIAPMSSLENRVQDSSITPKTSSAVVEGDKITKNNTIPRQRSTALSEAEKETHKCYMREALAMAQTALVTNEVPVGCVFVHPPTSTIIGRGMNATNRTHNGTRHAEFMAISSIISAGHPPSILRECDLYVTIEPCIMCASLLRQVGVRRVFFGGANERFGGTGGVLGIHSGNGLEKAEEGDYEVSGGWLREEAIVLLRRFYVQGNENAPEPKKVKKERVLRLDVEPDERLLAS